jgi:hypothetical protein
MVLPLGIFWTKIQKRLDVAVGLIYSGNVAKNSWPMGQII